MALISKTKKPSRYDADVIVIGSGAGGSIVAHTLSNSVNKVVLIEEGKLGGDCPNYSCIPTRALLETAFTAKVIAQSSKYGIKVPKCSANYADARHWANRAIASTGVTTDKHNYSADNIDVIKGHAHFINPWTISVGLKRFTARKFVIATGSSPYIPNITGLEDIDYITYKNFGKLEKMPKSIAIVGGGSMGYEYAQICSTFGAKVHLIEKSGHLLPYYDSEVGDLIEKVVSDQKIAVHTKTKVNSVKKTTKGLELELKQRDNQHILHTDAIIIATGNKPNLDIGLENALVKYNNDGIRTNSKLQTNQEHIFAVGGATGNSHTASSAIMQAKVAAHNIMHRKKHKYTKHANPIAAFGLPEIATVGKTEQQMVLTGTPYQTAITPISIVGRSFTTDYKDGFVKIIASHTGTVIGATIVAPHASELISELTFAIQNYRRACDVANTVHVFSSWSEAIRATAAKIYCI